MQQLLQIIKLSKLWFLANTGPVFLLLVFSWIIYILYKKDKDLFASSDNTLAKIILTILVVILVLFWFIALYWVAMLGFVSLAFGYSGMTAGWAMYLPLILIINFWLLTWRWINLRVQYNNIGMTILARLVCFMFIAYTITSLIFAICGVAIIFYPPHVW